MSEDKKNKFIYSMHSNNEADSNISIEIPGAYTPEGLEKRLKDFLLTHKAKKAPRIASDNTTNTQTHDIYGGLIKQKRSLVPDDIIKSIRVQNHLIASILRARANMLAMFGRPRSDRFDIGFEIIIRPEYKDYILPEEWGLVHSKILEAQKNYIIVENLKDCVQKKGLL